MITQDDAKNLLFFLKRCPTEGLIESTVLVGLAQKLKDIIVGDPNGQDLPAATE